MKPVVDSVILPADAQATCRGGTFSQTQGYDIPEQAGGSIPDQTFTFALGGATPCGAGTVTISKLAGDIEIPNTEQWTIWLGNIGTGVNLGQTPANTQCGPPIAVPTLQRHPGAIAGLHLRRQHCHLRGQRSSH